MKVLIARQSGLPVDDSKAEDFRIDWQARFDELKQKNGTDMLAMEKDLELMEKEMEEKYELVSKVELPKSGKAWKEIIETYSGVLVSTHKDTGEVVLIVMDQGI